MLSHNSQEEQTSSPASSVLISSQEVVQAVLELEARPSSPESSQASSMTMGQVIEDLHLEISPEQLHALVQNQRNQKAFSSGPSVRLGAVWRRLMTVGLGVALVSLGALAGLTGRLEQRVMALEQTQAVASQAAILSPSNAAATQTKNTTLSDGATPLMRAAASGNLDTVAALLEHGADVNVQDTEGSTALHWSVNGHATEIVRVLISHGANVNIQDQAGDTPLMLASGWGNTVLVRLLLAHGADASLMDKEGYTALSWAAGNAKTETVRALLEQRATGNADR